MNEILNAIKNRQTVRKFTGEKLTREELEQVAVAGRNAPTAKNTQNRRLSVVQDSKKIAALCAAMGEALERENYDMYGADAIIIVSDLNGDANANSNCACAMQNMMLAASSLGLGSVWINQLSFVSTRPEIRAILAEFGIPDTHTAWFNLALGRPAEVPAPNPKDAMIIDWVL